MTIRRFPPRQGRWAKGSQAGWRKQRARILRTHPICQIQGCLEPATEVHHLTPGTRQVVPDWQLLAVCHHHNPRGG
jgi:hypothetical protein